jgi:hypothetical protein
MRACVFDLECNGLRPDRIHCLSYRDPATGIITSLTEYDEMRKFISNSELLAGHNISRFDVVVIEKILGIKVDAKLIDTLAISWYLEPERVRHGLESYGDELGVKKPYIADWNNLALGDYVNRCERDVQINSLLWDKQWKVLLDLYGSEAEALRFLSYLEFKMDCAREQEQVGWKLDVNRCAEAVARLTSERDNKLEELRGAMPKVPIRAVKNKPAKPYKMNGSLSKAGEDWLLFCENRGLDPEALTEVEYVKDYKEPNPASSEQVKSWLYELGWKPETFAYKRDKETNEVRKIPQVAQDKTKGPGLCPSVLKLVEKEPKIKVLDGLAILNHRIGLLQGFLDNNEDGYLKAEVDGFTNTLRFKHRIIVNLPGVHNPYGEDIRGCLIAPKGHELCGSDMSGLEDRLKQHFIYPYDPEYVKEMNSDDFDPHLDLAVNAEAVSLRDAETYKAAEKKDSGIKAIRHTYKQGNYACQYGAGIPRLALTIGCSRETAERIHVAYWKRNWSIKQAAEDQTTKVCDGRMWLYNPISRFWYSLRAEKDKFSTLVQGSAVYCFDTWVREVRRQGLRVCGQFHDEVVLPVVLGLRQQVSDMLSKSIMWTNNKLKLNRELAIDVQFGENYAEIH